MAAPVPSRRDPVSVATLVVVVLLVATLAVIGTLLLVGDDDSEVATDSTATSTTRRTTATTAATTATTAAPTTPAPTTATTTTTATTAAPTTAAPPTPTAPPAPGPSVPSDAEIEAIGRAAAVAAVDGYLDICGYVGQGTRIVAEVDFQLYLVETTVVHDGFTDIVQYRVDTGTDVPIPVATDPLSADLIACIP